MDFVTIKPLSVNEAWQGARVKTDKYRKYESALLFLLPKINIPQPPLEVHYTFGLSSSLADWDNPVKPFQDVLQKKYGFNDKSIKRAIIEIESTPKGKEYIGFKIMTLKK